MRVICGAAAVGVFLYVSAASSRAQLGIGYATFLGGSETDVCSDVALDEEGSAYVLGTSNSYSWNPSPSLFFPGSEHDRRNLFVAKYDSSGKHIWTAFFGATGGEDHNYPGAIAANASGAYVTGATTNYGWDFPLKNDIYGTPGKHYNGVFVTRLNAANGTLGYSTFIMPELQSAGTLTTGAGIAVDSGGFAYVTGTTYEDNLPVINYSQKNRAGGGDAFALKLSSSGSSLSWATYLGGGGQDAAYDIAVDSDGNAYVTGQTWSADFPVTQGAYMRNLTGAGTSDAFVTKLSDKGRIWSTYLPSGAGSPYDTFSEYGSGIALDAQRHAYVACTYGSLDLNEYDPSNAFVAKFAQDGTGLNYLKCMRGSAEDVSGRIAVDPSGCAYVTGRTSSADFDSYTGLEEAARGARQGTNPQEMEKPDAFVTKISSEGRCLEYSTQLGTGGTEWGTGISVTSGGDAVVAGWTDSRSFPATIGADQEGYGGGYADGFLSDIFFIGAPGYCVRSSSLRVGDRFSVEARVNQNVEGPLDAFAILATNPTGGERMLGSFMLNGEIREGIVALARNLPGIQAPLSAVLMPEITIRENAVGSHTFYVVTTNPGLVPAGGMQMSPGEFEDMMQNRITELKKDIVKTVNFHKWTVEPPDLSGYSLPTAEEWDEITR